MATTARYPTARAHAQRLREILTSHGGTLAEKLRNLGVDLAEQPALTRGGYSARRGVIWLVVGFFLWGAAESQRVWHTQEAGLLLLCVGATLVVASVRRQESTEVRTL